MLALAQLVCCLSLHVFKLLNYAPGPTAAHPLSIPLGEGCYSKCPQSGSSLPWPVLTNKGCIFHTTCQKPCHLEGRKEQVYTGVWHVCVCVSLSSLCITSTGGRGPFFVNDLPFPLLVDTRTGLSYLTREDKGGIILSLLQN